MAGDTRFLRDFFIIDLLGEVLLKRMGGYDRVVDVVYGLLSRTRSRALGGDVVIPSMII